MCPVFFTGGSRFYPFFPWTAARYSAKSRVPIERLHVAHRGTRFAGSSVPPRAKLRLWPK